MLKWPFWQQWSLALGVLGLLAAFNSGRIVNPDISLAYRSGAGLGTVLSAMLVGAVLGLVIGRFAAKASTAGDSASTEGSVGWRSVVENWWLWAITLVLIGSFSPFLFQTSPTTKISEFMRTLRFSPMTGLAMRVVPGLDGRVEEITTARIYGTITEAEALERLRPLLRNARIDVLNPAFERMPDDHAAQLIAGSLDALKHLQAVRPKMCLDFLDSGIMNPTELSAQAHAAVTRYSDTLERAYESGRDEKSRPAIATRDEVAQLVEREGVGAEAGGGAAGAAKACASYIGLYETFASLPINKKAGVVRFLMSQPPP
jgi:hypothetical protein